MLGTPPRCGRLSRADPPPLLTPSCIVPQRASNDCDERATGRPCLRHQKAPRGEIVSVPLCGKRSRPHWIVPDGRPERRVFSLFTSHEPHQRPRHHRSDPGQLHQSTCQSSGHSGDIVFGSTLARHILISPSFVGGSPRVCCPRNSQNPGDGHTNSWRDDFLLPG